ncbi:U-box domain-containing protein 2 [Linum perenne]
MEISPKSWEFSAKLAVSAISLAEEKMHKLILIAFTPYQWRRRIKILNNISSFSLVDIKLPVLAQKYFHRAQELFKLLNSILYSVFDSDLATDDEVLHKKFAELDQSIYEVKELLQNWLPSSSKLFSVLLAESLLSRIRYLGLDIVEIFNSVNSRMLEELSSSSSSSSTEYCIQKLQNLRLEETSFTVKAAISNQVEGTETGSDVLAEIADSLSLRTSLEILIEEAALENSKEAAEQVERSDQVELFDKLIDLVTRMHDVLVKRSHNTSRLVPVPPPDLCCPLSLELMTDPVIVASGQTYERAFIKTWIEHGLTVCPKTRHVLGHTFMITNYTVKALIANWCDIHHVRLPDDRIQPLQPPSPIIVHVESSFPRVRQSMTGSSGSSLVSGGLLREEDLDYKLFIPQVGYGKNRGPQGHIAEKEEESLDVTTRKRFASLEERIIDSSSADEEGVLSSIETEVRKLVEDLQSSNIDIQREATAQIRELSKNNTNNRIVIADCGAITLLVKLLLSTDTTVQENSVTALLNLSIKDSNKTAIAEAGAIEPLIQVLKTGSSSSEASKENSAATLFSLSTIKELKAMIGVAGAVGPLVELLEKGTPRGKKDAATALFNLSMCAENRNRIVEAGAVKHLVELVHPRSMMVDKAVAVLANLATILEGREAIGLEGGIRVLVEVVELGCGREKEHAAAALLQMCVNSYKHCKAVLEEGVVPPLMAMLESGSVTSLLLQKPTTRK